MIIQPCAICGSPGVEYLDFEAGSNFENAVSVPLCDQHFLEAYNDEPTFEEKYADQITRCLEESKKGQSEL